MLSEDSYKQRKLKYLLLGLCLWFSGCRPDHSGQSNSVGALRIATTTSTRDSGLLDQLLPAFTRNTPCDLSVIAVGTGAALKMGEQGEADVLIVHAPNSERQFMQERHGQRHASFMKNYFILVGQAADPAQIKHLAPDQALQQIGRQNQRFVSRGDDSGTHKRELQLWGEPGCPLLESYIETGQGMGNTLMIANELQAYTLCDMATYLRFQHKIELVPLVSTHPLLENRYSVITVNPSKSSKINADLANRFFSFLQSAEAFQIIQKYQLHNSTLFEPITSTASLDDSQ